MQRISPALLRKGISQLKILLILKAIVIRFFLLFNEQFVLYIHLHLYIQFYISLTERKFRAVYSLIGVGGFFCYKKFFNFFQKIGVHFGGVIPNK